MKIIQSDDKKLVIKWGRLGPMVTGVFLIFFGGFFLLALDPLWAKLVGGAMMTAGILVILLSNTFLVIFDKDSQAVTVKAKNLLRSRQGQYQFSQINKVYLESTISRETRRGGGLAVGGISVGRMPRQRVSYQIILGLSDGSVVKLGRASQNYAQSHSAADLIAKFLGIEFKEE